MINLIQEECVNKYMLVLKFLKNETEINKNRYFNIKLKL